MTKARVIDSLPMLASVLIEAGNLGQLYRMWTQHSALGQNVWSYVAVLAALIMWLLYYRFRLGRTLAYYVTWIAVFMMAAIIVTIIILQGGFI